MTTALRKQQTIARPATIWGFGYWSGRDVHVEFRPAQTDTGVVFVRHDLTPTPRIRACVDHRTEVPRRTNLTAAGASVEMVEHLLAALAGLQIDNCEIWVDGAEMPGNDGSSRDAVEALLRAGIVAQDALRACVKIDRVLRIGNSEQWIEARPADRAIVKYDMDFGRDNIVGRHELEWVVDVQSFRHEIAPARTFILESDARLLRAQGLGLRTTYQDLLVFGADGPIDNNLRFTDECVRHKILDLIGDLALAGCDVQGYILAHRSGHRLNAELARALRVNRALSYQQRDSA